MKSFRVFITEGKKVKFTLKDLQDYFGKHDMAVVAANRDNHPDNRSNTRKLESEIKSSPYAYEPAKGGFVENKGQPNEKLVDEDSFVIVDVDGKGGLKNFAVKLGKKYPAVDADGGEGGQDSILFSGKNESTAALIGTTKREDAYPKMGQSMNLGQPRWGSKGEYYTKVKDGYFTFG